MDKPTTTQAAETKTELKKTQKQKLYGGRVCYPHNTQYADSAVFYDDNYYFYLNDRANNERGIYMYDVKKKRFVLLFDHSTSSNITECEYVMGRLIFVKVNNYRPKLFGCVLNSPALFMFDLTTYNFSIIFNLRDIPKDICWDSKRNAVYILAKIGLQTLYLSGVIDCKSIHMNTITPVINGGQSIAYHAGTDKLIISTPPGIYIYQFTDLHISKIIEDIEEIEEIKEIKEINEINKLNKEKNKLKKQPTIADITPTNLSTSSLSINILKQSSKSNLSSPHTAHPPHTAQPPQTSPHIQHHHTQC